MSEQVSSHLEVWTPSGVEMARLDGHRMTLGRSESNDIVLSWDRSAGRLHAALEPYPDAWSIRDLGSRNGTYLGSERIASEQALRHGDEIVIGRTRLVYRRVGGTDLTATADGGAPPKVSPAEHLVLVELCRPMLEGRQFRQPAAVRQIATALGIEPVTVKYHLGNLYKRFKLDEKYANRRVELANQALERRVITRGELSGVRS